MSPSTAHAVTLIIRDKEKMPRFLEGKAGAKALCSYMKAEAAEVQTVT
jgi:hypothetical protein